VSTVTNHVAESPAGSPLGFWAKKNWGDIVVALDGTQKSRDALSWAAGLASVTGARIRLVHALTPRQSTRSSMRLHGQRLLRSARSELSGLDPRIAIDSILTDDPIASVLGALSHSADLIVIGGRESGPIRDVLFGRNTTRIVAESACPVLVWRPQHTDITPAAPVVVGVDHSDSCTRAIEAAFWFADALEVPLTALHVGSPHRRPATKDAELEQLRALEWLGGRVDAAASVHPTVTVHLHLLDSSAEHELRLASATAHLLVVGSRGLGPWTGPLTGSVGQSLVHASCCPILVVR
jgi:nucleotide-binding universal stress UspA family protein